MSKVYVVAAKRSAIGSFLGSLAPLKPGELGAQIVKNILEETKVNPANIDEVIVGNVLSAGQAQGVGRQVSIKAGIPYEVPAYSVNIICGSGMKSVITAFSNIKAGEADLVIAGGTESMSGAGFILPGTIRGGHKMADLTMKDHMILDALTDAYHNIHMGITAENIAEKYGMTEEKKKELNSDYGKLYTSPNKVPIRSNSKNYESEAILEDVTFRFKEGVNLIDGKSGVGKSTLIKILLGLIKSSSGEVTIYSREDDLNLYSYSGQSNKLFNLSVIENLIYPKTVDHLSSSERMKLESLLDEFGFRKSLLNKDIAKEGENLSGGERKRLSILRALIYPSKVVILDEPFANLDPNNIEIIAQKIQNLSKSRIVIIVSHETSFPASLKFNTHLTISGT